LLEKLEKVIQTAKGEKDEKHDFRTGEVPKAPFCLEEGRALKCCKIKKENIRGKKVGSRSWSSERKRCISGPACKTKTKEYKETGKKAYK